MVLESNPRRRLTSTMNEMSRNRPLDESRSTTGRKVSLTKLSSVPNLLYTHLIAKT
jgi:hypothetical protein